MLSLQRILEIRTYKTVWVMGHKIRKAMAERDAHYQLAGLIEMDDTYIGGPKPGKRGRGAGGKSKVVVAVETPGDKPRFAAMRQVPKLERQKLRAWCGSVWRRRRLPAQMGGGLTALSPLCLSGMSRSSPVPGKMRVGCFPGFTP